MDRLNEQFEVILLQEGLTGNENRLNVIQSVISSVNHIFAADKAEGLLPVHVQQQQIRNMFFFDADMKQNLNNVL